MTDKRDPRVDPRTGDTLLVGLTHREVRTHKRGITCWQAIGPRPIELIRSTKADWRTWAKHAEIIHAAE